MASSNNIVQGGATVVMGVGTAATDLGYIKDGLTITPTVDLYLVGEAVEQLTLPVKAYRVSETIEMAFTIIEPTLANIKTAWDIAAATGGTGPITLDIGENQFTPQENILTFTGLVPGATQYVRSITAPVAVVNSPGEMNIGKAEETSLATGVVCLYDDISSNYALQISDAIS